MEFQRGESLGQPALINEQGLRFTFIDNEHISFGDVCRNLIGQQAQYGSRYVDRNFVGKPYLGSGLRIVGNPGDYHSLGIHPEDVDEFISRHSLARTYERGWINDGENTRIISEEEKTQIYLELKNIGAFPDDES